VVSGVLPGYGAKSGIIMSKGIFRLIKLVYLNVIFCFAGDEVELFTALSDAQYSLNVEQLKQAIKARKVSSEFAMSNRVSAYSNLYNYKKQ